MRNIVDRDADSVNDRGGPIGDVPDAQDAGEREQPAENDSGKGFRAIPTFGVKAQAEMLEVEFN